MVVPVPVAGNRVEVALVLVPTVLQVTLLVQPDRVEPVSLALSRGLPWVTVEVAAVALLPPLSSEPVGRLPLDTVVVTALILPLVARELPTLVVVAGVPVQLQLLVAPVAQVSL
jgi:hypothetical protein